MANITLRSGKGSPLTHDEVDDNFTNINNELSDYLPLAGGAVTGNITTTGNIAGRDVAADGTKLDGIELLADVTDTANVVDALTAGTNITIAPNGTISSAAAYTDADVDAYINASILTTDISEGTNLYYTNARADARVNAIVADYLPLAGGTVTGKTTFSDSARFDGIIDAHSNISLQSNTNISWEGTGDGVDIRGNNTDGDEELRFGVGDAIPVIFEPNKVTLDAVNVLISNKLTHKGDEDTFLNFGTNTLGITTSGTPRIAVSNTGLGVTGAITVSGNVDGRDIATDGTKLDGIEAAADVTDTANVVAALTEGTNITIENDGTISSAAAYTDADVDAYINASILTTDISEGSNLYYTNARVDAYINASILTTDISEGSNLYYTNARADARVNAIVADYLPLAGGSLTGNITTTGNIAGRDVAADGTKLDAIEAAADVTDTANVVAALTEGTNIDIAANGTISSTVTTYTDADVDAYINASILTTDISEGSNLYYTNARADARVNAGFSAKSTTDLDEGNNLYYTDARVDAYINASILTTDISEGSNLYYTNARARAAISESSTELAYNSTTGVLTFTQGSTSGVAEGSNLYYTEARADARVNAGFSAKSTTDLSEGNNLYYTDARADARVNTANVVATLTEGDNVDIAANGTISSTDTTYSVGDGGLTQKNFTTTLKDKLDDAVVSDNAETSSTTQVDHIQVLTAIEYLTLINGTGLSSDTLYLVSET